LSNDSYSVDIATRVVKADENIYVMQPGEGYWLYDSFAQFSHVFLDFPGLGLDFKEPAPDDKALRTMIVRSLTLSDWIRNDKRGKTPSRDLADYLGKDRRLRLGRYVGAVKRLYFDLTPGTIIVVPGRHYYDDVLIGEIVGKPRMLVRKSLYDKEPVPARKIEWLRRKPRSAFTREVREKFGTPNPLIQLERSLRGEVLKAGFDQFAYNGQFAARLNTANDDFNTLDDYNIQTFVNYVTGVLIADELGHTKPLSMADAIKILRANPDRAAALAQNINSIGFQRLIDESVRPIVVALLLSVAIVTPADAAPPHIQVTNSATQGQDNCKLEVAKRVEGAVKLMKLEEWKRVCESARDAHASTGLSTTMKVKKGAAVKK
jgi:hypothetical protein